MGIDPVSGGHIGYGSVPDNPSELIDYMTSIVNYMKGGSSASDVRQLQATADGIVKALNNPVLAHIYQRFDAAINNYCNGDHLYAIIYPAIGTMNSIKTFLLMGEKGTNVGFPIISFQQKLAFQMIEGQLSIMTTYMSNGEYDLAQDSYTQIKEWLGNLADNTPQPDLKAFIENINNGLPSMNENPNLTGWEVVGSVQTVVDLFRSVI